jgi:oxygen-dependent protoporphyrinogen oxidase
MRRIAILGGGISGLSAAFRLRELSAQHQEPLEIALYERDAKVGGCVRTVREDGLVMELGPDSLLVEKPAAAGLLRRLQLDDRIVDVRSEFKAARIVHGGRLHPIPPEFRLFTPTSLPALLRSGIFSASGIARAAMEPLIPKKRGSGDETLASFVTRRFGREILDRLAQPLIGGIYSGDPKRLGMRATIPQFLDLEQKYGSLLRAMHAAKSDGAAPRLASLRDGVGSIVEALQARLADSIHTGAQAVRLRRVRDGWWVDFAAGDSVRSDAVICALPSYEAALLLRGADAALTALLDSIRYNSIATVNLRYDASDAAHLPAATGFVVPFVERRDITAATFTTQKYPHRAPHGTVLLRVFIGGALQPDLVDRSDEELSEIAQRELSQLAGISSKPQRTTIMRWQRLLPEYGINHAHRVRELQQRCDAFGGLALAGSAYRGVGIPDCIESGEAAAETVFGYICR